MLLFAFICLVAASRVAMEGDSERAVPGRYVHLGRSAAASVRLSFVMPLRDANVLEEELLLRSNPQNKEHYGRWLSLQELSERFHPTTASMAGLVTRLEHEGAVIVRVARNGVVTVEMPRERAEELLQCEFHAFRERVTNKILHRSLDGRYSLPTELANDVVFVGGVRRLPVQMVGLRKKKPTPKGKRVGLAITPKLIRKRYQTVGIDGKAANNSMAVGSFIGQFYSPSDLNEFHTLFDPTDAGQQPTVHGPNTGSSPGVEANLDVQYLGAIGHKVAKFYDWSTPGNDPNPFLDLFAELANMTEVPYLFSISYGEPEIGNSGSYLDRLSQEFMMAGIRGTSILIASGDYGVTAQGQCPGNVFQPMWPVSSPYCTGVGGTKLGFLETGAEKVWSGSAGGFSDHFPIPSYQSSAVSTYQTKYSKSLPDQKFWNATGRGFPDVAAFGDGFLVVYEGAPTPVSGTSCAAPTTSGVIALLNDVQLQAGKPSLGFLNPWLYQNANILNDITEGKNEGCLGSDGFPATPGWDAVTGLGSPLYQKMAGALP